MSPATQAVLASWSFPPLITAVNILTALVYVRGWIPLHDAIPNRFTPWRLSCFVSGLATLQIALVSPIDTFDPFLLTSHMFQHLLLMMVIPPLLLLGDPAITLLKGLPNSIARYLLGPFLTSPALARFGHRLTHPIVALSLMTLAMFGWHVPTLYELALRSPGWHEVEHTCFLATSLMFWWPVIQPWPSRPYWPRWTIILYLLLGEFVNSVPSGLLAFSERVLYPSYLTVPRLAGISAQQDQEVAGALMWVIGSFVFLIPAAFLTVGLLSPQPAASPPQSKPPRLDLRVRRYALVLTFALPLAVVSYGWLVPQAVDIDGAVVRVQGVAGPFLATVFASPELHAGASDVSVLIQDRDSDKIVLDAAVDLNAKPAGGTNATIRTRALRRQSTNKLLEAATLDLATPGTWELNLAIRRGSDEGSLSTQLNVEPSDAEHAADWLYFLLGGAAIALFALHRICKDPLFAAFIFLLRAALVLLGAPAMPLLHRLPQSMARGGVGPFVQLSLVKANRHFLTNPAVCWFAATLALIVWHVPWVFERALRWNWLHELEHACFFGTGLLFIPLYLFCATPLRDALSAFPALCDRAIYSPAAALMRVFMIYISLAPAIFVTVQILSPQRSHPDTDTTAGLHKISGQPLGVTKLEVS